MPVAPTPAPIPVEPPHIAAVVAPGTATCCHHLIDHLDDNDTEWDKAWQAYIAEVGYQHRFGWF